MYFCGSIWFETEMRRVMLQMRTMNAIIILHAGLGCMSKFCFISSTTPFSLHRVMSTRLQFLEMIHGKQLHCRVEECQKKWKMDRCINSRQHVNMHFSTIYPQVSIQRIQIHVILPFLMSMFRCVIVSQPFLCKYFMYNEHDIFRVTLLPYFCT